MKNFRIPFFIAFLIFFSCSLSAQNTWVPITSESPQSATVQLVKSDIASSTFAVELKGFAFTQIQTPRGKAFTVGVDGATPIMQKGMPDLPKLTAALIIPDNANMEVVVVSSQFRDFADVNIAPSKGNLYRDTVPAKVNFTYDTAYEQDAFFPAEQAVLRKPYIMRDYRGQTVVVYPFAYNPVTKVLRVYYSMTVEVREIGSSVVNSLDRAHTARAIPVDFKELYERQFLNAESSSSRYTPLEERGNMLIISYGDFIPDLQRFVEWKTSTGMQAEVVDIDSIGSTPLAIKNYVAGYYASKGLTYLLLVGDHEQVPTMTEGNIGGPSDHAYGYLSGDDHYPEIFVGRFSAESDADVYTQVERSVAYEKNPSLTGDWSAHGTGIGSELGPDHQNEYDFEHIRKIRSDLLDFTYSSVSELYDGFQGGLDLPGNPDPSYVFDELHTGTGIINYVGHGNDNSWGTSGFSSSHVNALSNYGKWPFIISVACLNGNFLNQTCFAEAWLRASDFAGPTGAVAALMSTINQSWSPPMAGQDEMIDILVECKAGNIKRTFGGIAVNGLMKMIDSFGEEGEAMADTWLIFGDPSLMVRTKMPQPLEVIHDNVVNAGSDHFTILCNTSGAIACLTLNDQILGTAIISGESTEISIPAVIDTGIIKLTVTAFNYLPYTADVTIISPVGSYVIYNDYSLNDTEGNNNQAADYGESLYLTLGMKNAGSADAENVSVRISSTDPFISISDSVEMYPLIPLHQVSVVTNGFKMKILPEVPDGHVIRLSYNATSAGEAWQGQFAVTAHSPVLKFSGISVNDTDGNNNGRIDAGETVLLNLNITNNGSSEALDVEGFINSSDPYILINTDSTFYGNINCNETATGTFKITALPDTPPGYEAFLDFSFTTNKAPGGDDNPSLIVGQIPVLIIDLDGNHNSGPAIKESLKNVGVLAEYTNSWPEDGNNNQDSGLAKYQVLFVCLGSYPMIAVLSAEQGTTLANFMNNHGKVYMEGADTWSYNQQTTAHTMFKIDGTDDGDGDLAELEGVDDTFTQGMLFNYNGDNNFIDHIMPVDSAFVVLENSTKGYNTVIANDGGYYRTIGSSCEFGSVTSTDHSDRDILMYEYINFLGISKNNPLLANFIASGQQTCEEEKVTFEDYSAGEIISWHWEFPGGIPSTSGERNPVITYKFPGTYDVTLSVRDKLSSSSATKKNYIVVNNCATQSDEAFIIYPNPAKDHFTILLPDSKGKSEIRIYSVAGKEIISFEPANTGITINTKGIPAGIYFVKVTSDNITSTAKLVVAK